MEIEPLVRMEIESLRKVAEALEKAGLALEGRMVNPDYTAAAANEAGKHLVAAANTLRETAAEFAAMLQKKS